MTGEYDPVSPGDRRPGVALPEDDATVRDSFDTTGSGSDIVYRDHLDEDPFDEKTHHRHGSYDHEDGVGYPVEPTRIRPRKSSSRRILAALVLIVGGAAAIGVLAAIGYQTPTVKRGSQHITLDHIYNGTFTPKSQRLSWVSEGGSIDLMHGADRQLRTAHSPGSTTNTTFS